MAEKPGNAPEPLIETGKVSNQDIRKVLKLMDRLLGDLPEKEIEEFAQSEDFELYRKVLEKFVPEAGHEEKLKKKLEPENLTKKQVKKISRKLRNGIKKLKEGKINGLAGKS